MAQDLPSTEFLYDFLYYDVKRITTYLAQLDPDGALTGIIKSWGRTKDKSFSAQGNLELFTTEGGSLSEVSKLVERSYDPTWSLPIAVLNRLDELKFIERDLNRAGIGRMVLLEGSLSLIDVRMLRDMWPAILKFMDLKADGAATASNPPSAPKAQHKTQNRQKAAVKEVNKEVAVMTEVVKYLPHTIQLHLMTEQSQFLWGTLSPEHMVMNPDDLALKHGARVPGQWYVLAVLDAYPIGKAERSSFHEIFGMTDLARGMYQLLVQLQPAFGRPHIAYGVMPLLVFRTVRPGPQRPAE